MDFDISSNFWKASKRLPQVCRAAILDVEERLAKSPESGNEHFKVVEIDYGLYQYEQWRPRLRVLYKYDKTDQRIRLLDAYTPLIDSRVFVSYSHDDANWLTRLQAKVSELFGPSIQLLWTDRQIDPGEPWKDEIRRNLESAIAALLLVSGSFLESKFIVETELPVLLERRDIGKLWGKVRQCELTSDSPASPLLEYQWLWKQPLEELPRPEQEEKLKKAAQKLLERTHGVYEATS